MVRRDSDQSNLDSADVLDAMQRSPEAMEFFSQWDILQVLGPIPGLRR